MRAITAKSEIKSICYMRRCEDCKLDDNVVKCRMKVVEGSCVNEKLHVVRN